MKRALVQYRWFEPATPSDRALVLPNKLGSTFDTDHDYIAQTIADSLGAMVLAYERPGTGANQFSLGVRRELRPSHYAVVAAHTGRLLAKEVAASDAKQVVVGGHSSGATDSILIAYTETLYADAYAFTDPAGMENLNRIHGYARWLGHQLLTESGRPVEANNQHPGPSLPFKSYAASSLQDMVTYDRLWQTDRTYRTLQSMTERRILGDSRLTVAFPEYTFTAPPHVLKNIVRDLNARGEQNETSVQAYVLAATYHSYFDDPVRVSDFIRDSLEL